MSCLKLQLFIEIMQKYTNFDIILTLSPKSLKVLCLECLSYLDIPHLNRKVMS